MGKMMRNLVGVKPDLESSDLKRYVSTSILTLKFQHQHEYEDGSGTDLSW